jgi:hypothetical protein
MDLVLHDLRSTNGPVPKLSDSPPFDEVDDNGDVQIAGVWLRGQGGAGQGVSLMVSAGEAYRIYCVADQVQQWAIDELWPGSPTNWPPCPTHPNSHPLVAEIVGEVAVWMCPADSMPVAPIGALA